LWLNKDVLPLTQITCCFSFSKYISFVMHLYIFISRCIIKVMYLEKPKRQIIWDRGSNFYFYYLFNKVTTLCNKLTFSLHFTNPWCNFKNFFARHFQRFLMSPRGGEWIGIPWGITT
jgi:hypothetical protein